MSHFAKVVNGKVTSVIVATQEFIDNIVEVSPCMWIQTSYNTRGGVHYDPQTGEPSADQSKALRKNYASIGCTYDQRADAFYDDQPYSSWNLNTETYLWEPPVPYPTDGQIYDWKEETLSWEALDEQI